MGTEFSIHSDNIKYKNNRFNLDNYELDDYIQKRDLKGLMLFKLVEKYSEKSWNYDIIRPRVSSYLVQKFIKNPFILKDLHYKCIELPDLLMLLKQYPHHKWNWTAVINILKNYWRIDIDNENVREFIQFIPNDPSIYKLIQSNYTHQILKLIDKFPDKPWDYSAISRFCSNKDTIDLIIKYPHLPWDIATILENLSLEYSIYYLTKFYKICDWDKVSQSISLQVFEKYPNLNWNFAILSQRLNILDMIAKFPEKPWDWDYLSAHLKFDDFIKHSHLKWNLEIISQRHHVTKQTIEKFPHVRWNISDLIIHELWDIVKNHIEYYRHDIEQFYLGFIPQWIFEKYFSTTSCQPNAPNLDKKEENVEIKKNEYQEEGVIEHQEGVIEHQKEGVIEGVIEHQENIKTGKKKNKENFVNRRVIYS